MWTTVDLIPERKVLRQKIKREAKATKLEEKDKIMNVGQDSGIMPKILADVQEVAAVQKIVRTFFVCLGDTKTAPLHMDHLK